MDIISLLVLLSLLIYIFSRVKIVPTNHVVVCGTFGNSFTRTIKEGFNILWPFEGGLLYKWSYLDQNYKTHTIEGELIRLRGSQIDMSPFECTSSDGKVVSLDTLLIYNVFDPKLSIYACEDPLNLLCQQVIRYARREIINISFGNLTRSEEAISEKICKAIKEDFGAKYGLTLESCEIQNISVDEDTLRRRRQLRDGLNDITGIEKNHMLQGSKIFVK